MNAEAGQQDARRIAMGSDHAAFPVKTRLMAWLQERGWEVEDFGCFSEASTDYPDVARPLCLAVRDGRFAQGVLLCGTGLGMSYAANRIPGIRGALCWSAEVAALARTHNDANVLILPGRHPTLDPLETILAAYLDASFSGEARHQRRIGKIEGGCAT